jgi:hypothetical protein
MRFKTNMRSCFVFRMSAFFGGGRLIAAWVRYNCSICAGAPMTRFHRFGSTIPAVQTQRTGVWHWEKEAECKLMAKIGCEFGKRKRNQNEESALISVEHSLEMLRVTSVPSGDLWHGNQSLGTHLHGYSTQSLSAHCLILPTLAALVYTTKMSSNKRWTYSNLDNIMSGNSDNWKLSNKY